ncbi:MAG: acetate--CoA ligase family protein [Gemmatimonadales bacterium]
MLTNAGGPGIIAADACEACGLELPDLAPVTVKVLEPLFPLEASIRNPLDMIASATPEGYRAALAALLSDPGVDAVLAIFVPPLGVTQEEVTVAIAQAAAERREKVVFGVLMGHEGLPQGRVTLQEAGIPAFIFPESAARALAALSRFRELSGRLPDVAPESLPVDRAAAARLLEAARRAGRTRLAENEALALLAAYGIPVAPGIVAGSADQAAGYAARLGFPVVLKLVAPAILHKTEAGGVEIGLRDPAEVRAGFDRLIQRVRATVPGVAITGALVQPLVPQGRELIVGMTRDARFGPLVMFGLGGILVEVLRDVAFRIAPLTRDDARCVMSEIRGAAILDPVRGAPPVNRPAIEDVLLRVSQLAIDFPLIAELDVNPLMATPTGAVAADARVLLSPPGSPTRDLAWPST